MKEVRFESMTQSTFKENICNFVLSRSSLPLHPHFLLGNCLFHLPWGKASGPGAELVCDTGWTILILLGMWTLNKKGVGVWSSSGWTKRVESPCKGINKLCWLLSSHHAVAQLFLCYQETLKIFPLTPLSCLTQSWFLVLAAKGYLSVAPL